MGRTVPSASILLMQEQGHYPQFKKALAPRDQRALEQLFINANLHVAEAAYAAFELPLVIYGAIKIDHSLHSEHGFQVARPGKRPYPLAAPTCGSSEGR